MVESKKNNDDNGEIEEVDEKDVSYVEDFANNSSFFSRLLNNLNKQNWFADLKICFCILTRIPIYLVSPAEGLSISEASRFFPIIGAAIGLICALVVWVATWFSFSPSLLALFALITMVIVTGALHEDGLADTFDGLGGGTTRDHKLQIMRDSNIGSYGVMALLFSFGLRWAALTEIAGLGFQYFILVLISTSAGSRAALPAIMYLIPAARADGLSVSSGKPTLDRAITALILGIVFVFLLLDFRITIVALGLSILVTGLFVYFVAMRIGGQTGDVLGACQQITEITMLLVILMVGVK